MVIDDLELSYDYVSISRKECFDRWIGAEAAFSLHGRLEAKHKVGHVVAGGTIVGIIIEVD